jgi:PAS domain-containing protein
VVGLSISLLQSTLAAANEKLRRSREQIELAAESAKIGFTESLEGGKVIWTPEMERLFGLGVGAFEGTIADGLKRIHPEDRVRFEDERRKQIEQRIPEISYEYRILLPDGRTRWLEAGGGSLRNAVVRRDSSALVLISPTGTPLNKS